MAKIRITADVFFLDRSSKRPLQTQIREAVIASILSKQALPGAAMPSSRKLAEHLGVARMTVTLAYEELVDQGFLISKSRSGYWVADSGAVPRLPTQTGMTSVENSTLWQNVLSENLSARQKIIKPRDWKSMPYSFVFGEMDSAIFRHSAWRECVRQAMGTRDFDLMAGNEATDDPMLVEYILSRMLPRRGITANRKQVLITVGAQNAIWLAIELLTRVPLKAVCENPCYPDTPQALRWCGADVATVNVDDHGLPPDAIPDGTQAVFVTPSHHAPTGATMPRARREKLLEQAQTRDFVIVEDDYEFEMSFIEPPSPALKAIDKDQRVLYAGSFSKALFPGLRLGYLVGPEPVIAEARELRAMMLRHPPGHLQRTAAYFLAQGHYDLLIRDLRREFAKRRTAVLEALDKTPLEMAGAARFGGSCLWVKAPDGTNTEELAAELLKVGVVIEPGSPFFTGHDKPKEFFRLGYSSIPLENIPEGIRLIGEMVSAAPKRTA
ncbi:MocR-like pyridoxine biosynthesis transcription factor PdxR [Yoonia sediminilitoris]|uniref:GntR family transcriptional regulator n=1 Tax=Yoonia sediminilitoris TaxID=1286148 RepID=A0A2T6KLJ8_9RHOB|nr:PLP-dependent aminotransferase family protein [Yoonia sediminilitoris]PUB17102.1 GntR family transcriptional regulator [Yoonia sediminilitoris]RCW97397.1 GntR family transcriptional regulator [Yoonia sediminilitoris]